MQKIIFVTILGLFPAFLFAQSLLKDIYPGESNSFPSQFTPKDNQLFFTASDGITSGALWVTDGSETGTTKLVGENLNVDLVRNITNVNGTIYFFGRNQDFGKGLWKSDGTNSGTVLVKGNIGNSNDLSGSKIVANQDTIFFIHDYELWRSDGTEDGTFIIESGFSSIQLLSNFNGEIFLWLWPEQVSPWGIYKTNGGINSLQLVKEGLIYSPEFYEPTASTSDFMCFMLNSWELWKTDGTIENTSLVKIFDEGFINQMVQGFVAIDSLIYFQGFQQGYGVEFWRTNGTQEGTYMVKDLKPGGSGSYPRQFSKASENIFFVTSTLWKSDGTESGTVSVGGGGNRLTTDGIDVYFHKEGDIWIWDHTIDGVYQITDVLFQNNPEDLIIVDNKLFFTANDGMSGREIWFLDLNEIGTSAYNYSREFDLEISPNPGNGIFRISTKTQTLQNYHIEILDSNGRRLLEQQNQLEEFVLDISQFPQGSYFLKISNGREFGSFKIIHQK